MKIKNITDVKGFLDALCGCKGDIELLTGEGDRINLKSNLCQHLALTEMFSDARISDIDIVIHEPEDVSKLLDYLIRG